MATAVVAVVSELEGIFFSGKDVFALLPADFGESLFSNKKMWSLLPGYNLIFNWNGVRELLLCERKKLKACWDNCFNVSFIAVDCAKYAFWVTLMQYRKWPPGCVHYSSCLTPLLLCRHIVYIAVIVLHLVAQGRQALFIYLKEKRSAGDLPLQQLWQLYSWGSVEPRATVTASSRRDSQLIKMDDNCCGSSLWEGKTTNHASLTWRKKLQV